MNAICITIVSIAAAASLLASATPASAEVRVGVSIGYPGGYGVAQPVQPFYGSAPVYVAPAPVYAPRPYYSQREEWRGWREREERAAEWRYRHDDRHDYRHDERQWRDERNDGRDRHHGEFRDGHR